MAIKEAIKKVSQGKSLSFKEAREVFTEILEGKATPSQIASFLTSLSLRETKEKEEEILAAAKTIRDKALKLRVKEKKDEAIVDTCGTGGSGVEKFNISTTVALVVSTAGIKVAKHGNRAMSSHTGSADLLGGLGINIQARPEVMEEAVKTVGIGFLYAPLYHPALKSVAQIRREIGLRTIFNILGPLCSPAEATHQLLGVHHEELVLKIANVLRKLGVAKAMVVYGKDLKDEVTLTGETKVSLIRGKKIENFSLSPGNFGLKKCRLKDLEAKSVKESVEIVRQILDGQEGAPKDVVLANSSCCFYLLGKVNSLKEGVMLARYLIDSKKVKKKLLEFKRFLEKNA